MKRRVWFTLSSFLQANIRKQQRVFPGGPVVRIHLAMQGTQVQPLVREMRPHMSRSN